MSLPDAGLEVEVKDPPKGMIPPGTQMVKPKAEPQPSKVSLARFWSCSDECTFPVPPLRTNIFHCLPPFSEKKDSLLCDGVNTVAIYTVTSDPSSVSLISRHCFRLIFQTLGHRSLGVCVLYCLNGKSNTLSCVSPVGRSGSFTADTFTTAYFGEA